MRCCYQATWVVNLTGRLIDVVLSVVTCKILLATYRIASKVCVYLLPALPLTTHTERSRINQKRILREKSASISRSRRCRAGHRLFRLHRRPVWAPYSLAFIHHAFSHILIHIYTKRVSSCTKVLDRFLRLTSLCPLPRSPIPALVGSTALQMSCAYSILRRYQDQLFISFGYFVNCMLILEPDIDFSSILQNSSRISILFGRTLAADR